MHFRAQAPNPSSSGRSKGRFVPFGPPLMSNVRPHGNRVLRSNPSSPNRLGGSGAGRLWRSCCGGGAASWLRPPNRPPASSTTPWRFRSRRRSDEHQPARSVPSRSWPGGQRSQSRFQAHPAMARPGQERSSKNGRLANLTMAALSNGHLNHPTFESFARSGGRFRLSTARPSAPSRSTSAKRRWRGRLRC